jgi:hypothetical protein
MNLAKCDNGEGQALRPCFMSAGATRNPETDSVNLFQTHGSLLSKNAGITLERLSTGNLEPYILKHMTDERFQLYDPEGRRR